MILPCELTYWNIGENILIEIYSKDNCTHCNSAKTLLGTRNKLFTEYKLGVDYTREQLLEKFPNARTFPVVVIDGFHIGGFTELNKVLTEELDDTRRLLNEEK
jgi:glutaredoxin 3